MQYVNTINKNDVWQAQGKKILLVFLYFIISIL